jgi:hypothetical protein
MYELREEYKEKGYLILRNFFDKEELTSILTEAQQTFATQIKRVLGKSALVKNKDEFEADMFDYFNQDMASFIGTGKNVQHSLSLYRLNTDQRIIELLKSIGITNPTIGVKPSMQ